MANHCSLTKACPDCKQALPLSAFALNRSAPDGHSVYCRDCKNQRARAYRSAKPDVYRRRDSDRYYRRRVQKADEAAVRYYAIPYEVRASRVRARNLWIRYRLTPEMYETLWNAQEGLCAICGTPFNSGVRLDVDHDHETGRVRGLLCHPCNLMIGYAKDSIARLEEAINYLRR